MTTSLLYFLTPTDLISKPYLALQQELHARPEGYGDKGDKWVVGVRALIARFGATSVLDYGCGAGMLVKALRADTAAPVRLDEYDPAVPGKSRWPEFADLVVCTDVLEHVEPERLGAVLAHLRTLARKAVFLVVATRPASRTLADGRNAHLIVESESWWVAQATAAGFAIAADPPISPSVKPSREWVAVLTPISESRAA